MFLETLRAQSAERLGVLDRVKALKTDLLRIEGILQAEIEVRKVFDSIYVTMYLKHTDIYGLGFREYFAARRRQLDDIMKTCETHGLRDSGDRMDDDGMRWRMVFSADFSWFLKTAKEGA